MTTPRLFVTAPLLEGVSVPATPGQAHYLGTVMRRGVGDPVRAVQRRGRRMAGAHRAASGATAPNSPSSTGCVRRQPEPDLWLLFALLKRDATDLVVRAATELGVSVVQPVLTARTNAGAREPGPGSTPSRPRRPSRASG